MDDQEKKDAQREAAEDKMINDAFQHLLDTYLASRHRKKTDIITKAFNFGNENIKAKKVIRATLFILFLQGINIRAIFCFMITCNMISN